MKRSAPLRRRSPIRRGKPLKRSRIRRRRDPEREAAARLRDFGPPERCDWYQHRRCATCGRRPPSEMSHAWHSRGAGGGPDDVIPQCAQCHRGAGGLHTTGRKTYDGRLRRRYGWGLPELAVRYAERWRRYDSRMTPNARRVSRALVEGRFARGLDVKKATRDEIEIELIPLPVEHEGETLSGPWVYLERLRIEGRAVPTTHRGEEDREWMAKRTSITFRWSVVLVAPRTRLTLVSRRRDFGA